MKEDHTSALVIGRQQISQPLIGHFKRLHTFKRCSEQGALQILYDSAPRQ